MRRGDNIPTVADYAHWNEEAEAVWYAENRYDMEHWDEEMDDDSDDDRFEEPDPFQDVFASEMEARAFMAKYEIDERRWTISEWKGEWIVEHFSEKGHKARKHH